MFCFKITDFSWLFYFDKFCTACSYFVNNLLPYANMSYLFWFKLFAAAVTPGVSSAWLFGLNIEFDIIESRTRRLVGGMLVSFRFSGVRPTVIVSWTTLVACFCEESFWAFLGENRFYSSILAKSIEFAIFAALYRLLIAFCFSKYFRDAICWGFW